MGKIGKTIMISLLSYSCFYEYGNRAELNDFSPTMFSLSEECKNKNLNIMAACNLFKLI